MLCLVSPEERVPKDHPLREIRRLADVALATMSDGFDAIYAEAGRPSVPPERLLKASLLIALHSIRSERQFCEQLEYNLLFRWFLDMDMLEPAFDPTTFTKNRQRLMDADIAAEFFAAVRNQASDLMSREHFSVDGTLLEAWASMKSFRPKDEDGGTTTAGRTFEATSVGTTRTSPRPIPRRDSSAKAAATRRACASPVMPSSRTVTASSSTCA